MKKKYIVLQYVVQVFVVATPSYIVVVIHTSDRCHPFGIKSNDITIRVYNELI